jgi:hypothetical protein
MRITVATIIAVLPFGSVLAQSEPTSESVLVEFSIRRDEVRIVPAGDSSRALQARPETGEMIDGRWTLGPGFAVGNDTAYIGGVAYEFARFGRMEIERQGNRPIVRIFDRGAAAAGTRRHNLISVDENTLINPGEFMRGFVLQFGGKVTVAGEVNRSVVVVGGDVHVDSGAVVRGSVVAFGGSIRKSDEAAVYGDVFAGNRQRFRPRIFDEGGMNVVDFSMALDYNRVTGVLPWARLVVGPGDRRTVSLHAASGYAFESELWHYRIDLGRNERRGPIFLVGAYRDTKNDDQLRIGDAENLIFALLFRHDYRDYYFAEGFKIEGGWAFGRDRKVSLSYHNELIEPLEAHPQLWSLFGGDPFPPNYARLRSVNDPRLATDFDGRLIFLRLQAEYHLPYFPQREAGEWRGGVALETSHPDLKSDFNYSRYYAWLTREQPLWRDQSIRARALAGGSGGALPAFRAFYLGGVGSLPGFGQKEFFGKKVWLGNLEYAWTFGGWALFALADAGQAGSGNDWTKTRIHADVGLGVSIQETFRAQVSWAATESDRDPLVSFRFTRPF